MTDINSIMKGDLMNSNIGIIKYFQATQSIALFIVPAIILNYLLFNKNSNFIIIGKIPTFGLLLLIILLMLFILPVIEKLMQWNEMIYFPVTLENKFQQMENEAGAITKKLLSGKSIPDLLINIFVIAAIPAIGEEFLFRGIIQRLFSDWLKNSHIAIIFGAILFSGIHLQFYGFFPRMMLGILFGYLFYWSRNIWLPVIAHFLNNFITVMIHFLINNKIRLQEYSTDKADKGMLLLITAIILTTFLVLIIRKICIAKLTEQDL